MAKKPKPPKPPYRVVLWSGGKDSTATLILAHEKGEPIDLVLMSLMWFDKKRGIPAENKKHLAWVMNYAKPLIESWGYKVKFVSSDKDYIYWFYKIRQSSEMHPETIGKYYGFVLGGSCKMQGEKALPAQRYLRQLRKEYDVTEYCGICIDEPDRLAKLHARKGQRSLLEEERLTQWDTKRLCKRYGLLSPDYNGNRNRAGNCWFCPNQKIPELAELKTESPELYRELEILAQEKNTVARGFKYGVPFEEIDRQVKEYLANPPPPPAVQLSLFDDMEDFT